MPAKPPAPDTPQASSCVRQGSQDTVPRGRSANSLERREAESRLSQRVTRHQSVSRRRNAGSPTLARELPSLLALIGVCRSFRYGRGLAWGRSWAGFVDEVEGCFGGAAEPGEP